MKIFFLEQNVCSGWDTYDSCIVIAKDKKEAKLISVRDLNQDKEETSRYDSWPGKDEIKKISIEYIGEAKRGSKKEVICSSFNAG